MCRAKILHRFNHHLRRFHQQTRQPNYIRIVLPATGYQLLRRHLDAQVHHAIAVVGQDNLHQVFPDVVDISLHRCQQHLPREAESARSMWGSRCETANFIASALCRTSATINWLALNCLPTSSIPAINGPLMMSRGSRSCIARSRSSASPSLLPSINTFSQTLVQRQRRPFFHRRSRSPVAEMGRKRRHRIVAPIPYQVLRQPALFFRYRGITLQ